MAAIALYLASPCYGGLAHVRYLRAVLALRAACAAQGMALRLDLGGGEALVSRAHAGMLARFLASNATHLLFVDGDADFDAATVLQSVRAHDPVAAIADRGLLIRRDAAEQVVAAHPELHAGLGDVRSNVGRATMVFEAIVDSSGAYSADLAAFGRRWRSIREPQANDGGQIPEA